MDKAALLSLNEEATPFCPINEIFMDKICWYW
jgi:hypothetical protein